jgi:Transcription termination factor nusG
VSLARRFCHLQASRAYNRLTRKIDGQSNEIGEWHGSGFGRGWSVIPKIFNPSQPHTDAVNDATRWYAVHTQPNREGRAKNQLENQAYEVFLPRRLKTVRHARKLTNVAAPLDRDAACSTQNTQDHKGKD